MITPIDLDLHRDDEPPPTRWRALVRSNGRVVGTIDSDDPELVDDDWRTVTRRRWALRIAEIEVGPDRPRLDPSEISVVVCTRDRAELLDDGLARLGALDPAPGEVLVVDNAPSDDATEEVVARHGVEYVRAPVPGLDRARNVGWRSARGSVVLYVDDDARADPKLVGAHAVAFGEPAVGAVAGLVLPAELDHDAQIAFEERGGMAKGVQRRLLGAEDIGVQAFRLGVGTNMAFRRPTLEAIGGFDPDLDVGTASRGGGDLAALWRVLATEWLVLYEPDAVVRHIHRRTIDDLVAQFRDYGTAYRAVLERIEQNHPERAAEVHRELRRWHRQRHLRSPLAALARGDLLTARLLVSEALGSRAGVASVRASKAASASR